MRHPFELVRSVRWKQLWPGLLLVVFCCYISINTVLNNAHISAATVYDSTFYTTLMWRSGWTLQLAPIFHDAPYFNTHVSPFFYLPTALSYIYPWDFLTFCGLVYGLFYGAQALTVYCLIEFHLRGRRYGRLLATLAAFMFLRSYIIIHGAWEPHMEVISPLFEILMFWAWQRRKYGWSALCFFLAATIREDLSIVFGAALGLLAGFQYLRLRVSDPAQAQERLRYAAMFLLGAVVWCVAMLYVQKIFFSPIDIFHNVYFPKDDPFGHLTSELLWHRAQGIGRRLDFWLPFAIILFMAYRWKDGELAASVLAFLPFWFVYFISANDLSAGMGTYKPFPLVVSMVMPALIALDRPLTMRRRYLTLQMVVLLCACSTIYKLHGFYRWFPHELTYHFKEYEDFRQNQLPAEMDKAPGHILISVGVMALYPYDTQVAGRLDIRRAENDPGAVETIIWFDHDRDRQHIKRLLAAGHYTKEPVAGTKIFISHKIMK